MHANRLINWLGLAALVAMFGSAFLFTKFAVQEIPPVSVVTARLLTSALLLLIITYWQGERLQTLLPYWRLILILSITGNCLPFFVIAWGQQYIDSSLAGILMAMMPLTTVVLAHFFVQGERINRNKIIGFCLGFTGVVILMQPDLVLANQLNWLQLVAMLSVLGGALSYAVNSIIAHSLPKISLSLISAGVLVVASFIMLPFAYAAGFDWWPATTWKSSGSVLFLGVFASGFATIIYFSVIRHAGAAFLSQINYLIPVWAVFIGMIFGGESLTVHVVIALVVILAGIAIAQRNVSSRYNQEGDKPPTRT